MKFTIARSPLARPILSLFSATEGRSFIDIDRDQLEIRFGFFHQVIARDQLRSVSLQPEPRWYQRSIGWRWNLGSRIALLGATHNLVRLELTERRRMFIGVWVRADEIIVSLEQPALFVESLRRTT